MEILDDALLGLKAELAKGGDIRVLFDSLEALAHQDFRTFEETASILFKEEWDIEEGGISAKQLFRDPTYCHTANLPAQARYLGYVTDKPREDADWFDYNKGNALSTMWKVPNPQMKLTYIPRGRNNKCNSTLNIDFKVSSLCLDLSRRIFDIILSLVSCSRTFLLLSGGMMDTKV
jgi:hypothetical protein